MSMGGHYNPFNMTHGGPDDETKHVGDLGNIETDEDGTAIINIESGIINLQGEISILGRGCVVHSDEDDLGRGGTEASLAIGSTGDRIACGVVAIAAAE